MSFWRKSKDFCKKSSKERVRGERKEKDTERRGKEGNKAKTGEGKEAR